MFIMFGWCAITHAHHTQHTRLALTLGYMVTRSMSVNVFLFAYSLEICHMSLTMTRLKVIVCAFVPYPYRRLCLPELKPLEVLWMTRMANTFCDGDRNHRYIKIRFMKIHHSNFDWVYFNKVWKKKPIPWPPKAQHQPIIPCQSMGVIIPSYSNQSEIISTRDIYDRSHS